MASPTASAAGRQLKDTNAGGVPLIGDLVSDDGLTLLGCDVLVSNQTTANRLLVLDKADVLVAFGGVQIAVSQDVFFGSDSLAVRATLRIGWNAVHANRIGKISTATGT